MYIQLSSITNCVCTLIQVYAYMLHIWTPFKVYNHIAVYPLDYNYAEHLQYLQTKSLPCFTTHIADIPRITSIPLALNATRHSYTYTLPPDHGPKERSGTVTVSGTATVIPNLLVPITTLNHYVTAIAPPNGASLNLQTLTVSSGKVSVRKPPSLLR